MMYHCAWRMYNSLKRRENSGEKVNAHRRWREISEFRFTVLVRGIIGCRSACVSNGAFQLEEARREKWCAQVYTIQSMCRREAVHIWKNDTFCKDHKTVVKMIRRVYYKVIRRCILWEQDFKMCRVGIQCMTYFFLKKYLLATKDKCSVCFQTCPCLSPFWSLNLADAQHSRTWNL